MPSKTDFEVTRREVLSASAASLAMPIIPGVVPGAQAAPAIVSELTPVILPVAFDVNGKPRHLVVDTRTTLLDALRETLRLTGTKKGCDHGQCGACTVIVDGQRINSCLTLAVMHGGSRITTIEGLGTPENLHPMQAAFHRLPGDKPQTDTVLEHGELITAVTLPQPIGGTHIYRKVRDRASYAFALVSIAAVLQRDGTGRVAVGGVAPRPWRVEAAEKELPRGAKAVAAPLMDGARPTHDNAFKVMLVERTLAAVIADARG